MGFECKFCGKEFVQETRFLKHECDQMLKMKELKSNAGQTAYLYYSMWMKAYNRKVPDIETFATSKFYRSFVNFAEYAKKMGIANVEKFIKLMKEKDISPSIWRNDVCYKYYLEWIDRVEGPYDAAATSVETLFNEADQYNCTIPEFIDAMPDTLFFNLVRERKLSMWIVFCSKKLGVKLREMNRDTYKYLMEVVDPEYWSEQLGNPKNKSTVEYMKNLCIELEI
jgi:hypothetical protein